MAISAKIVVVIPTYNEAENIEKTIKSVFDTGLKDLAVLVVDDGSPDGTAEKVASLAEKNPYVLLLNRGAKKGLGSAYYDGFTKALGLNPEIVLSMDADGSHPAELIPKLVEAVQKGADAAVASRYSAGGKWAAGFSRMVVSRGANLLAKISTGAKVRDATSGFRAYSSRAITFLLSKPFETGYVFQVEIIHRLTKAGYKIVEVPFVFKRRETGKSKLSWKEIVHFFFWCVKTWFQRIYGR
ncbi:MAG: polyprenol monophosphomannose synthase [Candidatus Caldarchaeum sp.]